MATVNNELYSIIICEKDNSVAGKFKELSLTTNWALKITVLEEKRGTKRYRIYVDGFLGTGVLYGKCIKGPYKILYKKAQSASRKVVGSGSPSAGRSEMHLSPLQHYLRRKLERGDSIMLEMLFRSVWITSPAARRPIALHNTTWRGTPDLGASWSLSRRMQGVGERQS